MCKTGSEDWLPGRKYLIFLFEFPVGMSLFHPKMTDIEKLKIKRGTEQQNTVQKSARSIACTFMTVV